MLQVKLEFSLIFRFCTYELVENINCQVSLVVKNSIKQVFSWLVTCILYKSTVLYFQANLRSITTKPTHHMCAPRRLRSASAAAKSDQSSLGALWVSKDTTLNADSEDAVGRKCHLVSFVVLRHICKINTLWASGEPRIMFHVAGCQWNTVEYEIKLKLRNKLAL